MLLGRVHFDLQICHASWPRRTLANAVRQLQISDEHEGSRPSAALSCTARLLTHSPRSSDPRTNRGRRTSARPASPRAAGLRRARCRRRLHCSIGNRSAIVVIVPSSGGSVRSDGSGRSDIGASRRLAILKSRPRRALKDSGTACNETSSLIRFLCRAYLKSKIVEKPGFLS